MGYEVKNDKVKETVKINLIGDTIPHSWFNHIKKEDKRSSSGYKTDSIAILILANIVYWYKPRIIKDEETDLVIGYEQKFKEDMLQKSYDSYMKKYGAGRKAVKGAFDLLEEMNLIHREFRNIKDKKGNSLNNVMFVEPKIKNIKEITYKYYDDKNLQKKKEDDCQNGEVPHVPQKDNMGGGHVPQKGHIPQKGDIPQKDHMPQKDNNPPLQKDGTNTDTTFTGEFNNNNNKKSDCEKNEIQKVHDQISQLHKNIFGRKINDYQLGLFTDFINQGVSGELIIELFKYVCGRNGNQIAFYFNKLESMVKKGLLKKEDLDNAKKYLVEKSSPEPKPSASKKNKRSKNNNSFEKEIDYKWKDLFADMEQFKEDYNKPPNSDSEDLSLGKLKNIISENDLSLEETHNVLQQAMSISFNPPQYNGFLKNLKLVSFEGSLIKLKAPNVFEFKAIMDYKNKLNNLLNNLFDKNITVEIEH